VIAAFAFMTFELFIFGEVTVEPNNQSMHAASEVCTVMQFATKTRLQ
jgi:hypothetical protein